MLTIADPPPRHSGKVSGVLVALAVAGPILVFDPAGWAVVGPAKWALVSMLVPAIAMAVTWRRPVVLTRSWAYGWVALLLVGCVAATIGLDPISAWIGTPDRRFGMWTWLLMSIAFAAGQQLEPGSVRTMLRGATVAGAGLALVAAFEWAGFPLTGISFESGRLGSTMGSPAYLGAALTILVPVTVGQAADPDEGSGWRRTAGIVAVASTLAAVGTGTRAAWIGLAAAGVFTAPRWWPIISRDRWRLIAATAAVALGLLATPVPSRVAATFSSDDPFGASRLDEWTVATRVVIEHPVLGTGPEGYRIAFPTVVDAAYERSYGRAVMPDRAHNGLLDVVTTLGAGGGLLYLAAIGGLITAAWRARELSSQMAGMAAGMVGYLVQQQFLFPLAEVDSIFWLIAGVVVGATSRGSVLRLSRTRALPVALAVLAGLSLLAGVADVAADRAVATAFERDDLTSADRATQLRPDSFRTWLVAASLAASGGSSEDFGLAVDRIRRAREISPGDPRLAELEAGYLTSRAVHSGSSEQLTAALTAWEGRLEADPVNARVWLGAGSARLLDGDVLGAEQAFLEAAALAPRDPAPWVSLTRLYVDLGRADAATNALRRARSLDPAVRGLADLEAAVRSIGGDP